MTTLVITEIGDTWINADREGVNYEDTNGARMKSGSRFVLLLPELPPLAGETVLDAFLVQRGAVAVSAQTETVTPISEEWSPGTVKYKNRPAVNAAAAVSAGIAATAADVAVTVPGLAPILQAVADGTDWYGIQLSTNTATEQRFRTTDSGLPAWELHIELSDVPEVPTNLRPDGGGMVETSRPVLAWDFGGPRFEQAEFRVQVDTPAPGVDPDDVAPDFDTGWLAGVDPDYDLATESSYTPPGAGPHYWRVQCRTAAGPAGESPWSDWADYTVGAMPELVVDSPTGPFGDPSPTIAAHLASGVLAHWNVIVTGPDRSDVRARSELQRGPLQWQVPLVNRDLRRVIVEPTDGGPAGWARLRAWPEGDRAVAVGQPPYREVWIPLYFDDDIAVAAPENLSVVQYAAGDPRLVWTWTHNETPEVFLPTVDGRSIARLDPADLDVDGGLYTWVDSGQVSPLRPHTLGMAAAEDGRRSPAATVSEHTHVVEGVWLLPTADIDPIRLAGTAVGDFAHSDRVATFTPMKGPEVDVIYDYEGLKSTFRGSVHSGQDLWATLDRIEALRVAKVRTARMVWGSQTMVVRVKDLSATSADEILPGNLLHNVRFGFVQVGD